MVRYTEPSLIVQNEVWDGLPNKGFLTPTGFFHDSLKRQFVYGAVRDEAGRAVIRAVEIVTNNGVLPFRNVCFDRRGSAAFDQDGTILGHVNRVGSVVRLYYVGFKRSLRVKFQAFSGLAESLDEGQTFVFRRRILDKNSFPFLDGYQPDIVACHWNNLDFHGDGIALISIGDGWLRIGNNTYPKYSSFLICVKNFQFDNLICELPQKSDIYRLGRPRFLSNDGMKIAVATGGKRNGDYRPYFFEFTGENFLPLSSDFFPIQPGSNVHYKKQVSYPELIKSQAGSSHLFLFNGDDMGALGCFAFASNMFEAV